MRIDAPAILIPLLLRLPPAARPSVHRVSRPSSGLGLPFFVVSLLAALSIGAEATPAQTLLTSECPDGQSVCQVDSRSSTGAAVDPDRAQDDAVGTAGPEEERDAMPLLLTNADLGSTRAELLEREAAEREVRLQRQRERARAIERRLTTASETEREGGANMLIPGSGTGGGADEVWVSMPRDGERVVVGAGETPDADPGAEASHGSEATPPSDDETQPSLADCMERSIRAGNGFIESRRVCEALFPGR